MDKPIKVRLEDSVVSVPIHGTLSEWISEYASKKHLDKSAAVKEKVRKHIFRLQEFVRKRKGTDTELIRLITLMADKKEIEIPTDKTSYFANNRSIRFHKGLSFASAILFFLKMERAFLPNESQIVIAEKQMEKLWNEAKEQLKNEDNVRRGIAKTHFSRERLKRLARYGTDETLRIYLFWYNLFLKN